MVACTAHLLAHQQPYQMVKPAMQQSQQPIIPDFQRAAESLQEQLPITSNSSNMKVFVFLADGFEEIEAIAPIDIFRRAEIEVVTVSIAAQKAVNGAHGIPVLADTHFSVVEFADDDLLFLPGGMPGTKNLDAHVGLKNLIKLQAQKGGKLAAICAAPSILGKMELLQGKEAICYPGFEKELVGATLSESKVVKAENIFTAKGAGVAIQFALKLVEELKGKEEATRIANSICL